MLAKVEISAQEAIDRLGVLKAQIANLKIEEDEMRAIVIAQGEGPHEGAAYRATVSNTVRVTDADVRNHPEVAKVINRFLKNGTVSLQWLAGNAKRTYVTTVRVVARTGRGVG